MTERRRTEDSLHDKLDKLGEQYTGLIGMLTHHAGEEEKDLKEIKERLNGYFYDLDAHTHTYHHSYVASEITQDEKDATRWEKIKTGLIEKAFMFVLGGIVTYLMAVTWVDFGNRIRAVPEKSPVKYEQVAPPKLGEQTIAHLYIPGIKDAQADN